LTDLTLLTLSILTLALAGLFAGFETGLYSVNRVRLRLQLELKSFGARSLSHLERDLPGTISTNLIGTNLAQYVCVACVTQLLHSRGLRLLSEELAATLIMSPIIFVFAEMTPKDMFRQRADRWSYYVAPMLRVSHWLLYPFAFIFRTVARLAWGRAGLPASEAPLASRLGLRALIGESGEEGVLTGYQTAIAANITHLQGKRLRNAMVPLHEAVAIASDASLDELEELAARHHFSRLPVFKAQRDHVVGIVNVLDHLFSERRGATVAELLRPAPRLKEGDGIYASLVRLRRARMPMGIVQGPNENAVGIVTIKDLVEEIVGELEAF